MLACQTCPSYRNGKGSLKCATCPEVKNIGLARSSPCVAFVQIPRELLEQIEDNSLINVYDLLTDHESTLIFQLYQLQMTQQEIANYHNITQPAVMKQKKRIIDKLRVYMLKKR
jgi:DNA-directed RNA polymerase specialized sigma24 family protein